MHLNTRQSMHFMWSLAIKLLWDLPAVIVLYFFFKCFASSLFGIVIFSGICVLFWPWSVWFLNFLSIFRISFFKHCCLSLVVSELDVLDACSDVWWASWHPMDAVVFLLDGDYIEVLIIANSLLRFLMLKRNFICLFLVVNVSFLVEVFLL